MASGTRDQRFAPVREAMTAAQLPELAIRTFAHYFNQLLEGETGLLSDGEIAPVDTVRDLDKLPDHSATGLAALGQAAVIKLNGGLGTSMGLNQAKSLLPARTDQSFLELIARQVLCLRRRSGSALPLILMNSFATEADSLRALEAFADLSDGQAGLPLSFLQHRVPRLDRHTLKPIEWPAEPQRAWCPPGHGDLYTALVTSGLMEQLQAGGFRYLFVSNADNLGATLDPNLLGLMASENIPFLMEVTDRTAADRKGGHLALDCDGRLLLRESAQCPAEDQDLFQDIERYRYFNTNNLWINLEALADTLARRDGILGLPLIRNVKRVVPDDASTPEVIQLETAMGAAISAFDGAQIVRVPRRRFAPVKTTSDLLVLWSDHYQVDADGQLLPASTRPVHVQLDPRYYASIKDFRQRFPSGAPSLIEADNLTVSGNIVFEDDVQVRGTVRLCHADTEPRVIRAGTRLDQVKEN